LGYAVVHRREGGSTPAQRPALMALGAFIVVAVPFVKYPLKGPPGATDPATISQRTVVYHPVMVRISLVIGVLAAPRNLAQGIPA
jgi:hypothetical protein